MKDPVIIEARKMLVKYLREQATEKKVSTYRLAELTGMDRPNIQRIFSGKYSPTLDTFMLLARALNCYIFIIDKNDESDLASDMKKRWRRPADDQ